MTNVGQSKPPKPFPFPVLQTSLSQERECVVHFGLALHHTKIYPITCVVNFPCSPMVTLRAHSSYYFHTSTLLVKSLLQIYTPSYIHFISTDALFLYSIYEVY